MQCIKFSVVILINLILVVRVNAQTSDSAKVVTLIKEVKKYQQINIDSSTLFAKEAYSLSLKSKNDYLKCCASIALASVYQDLSEYKQATTYFNQAIYLSEKLNNKKLILQSTNGMANLFAVQKQWDQAAELYTKSIVLCKEVKDTVKTAVVLMNLANIEYNKSYFSNNYEVTNKAYEEALHWSVLGKDSSQQLTCLGNWGMSLGDEGKFEESIDKLNQAVVIAKNIKHHADLVYLYHYMGRTHGFMKKYNLAIDEFLKSLKIAYEFKDVDYISENHYCLAESNYGMGNYKVAYDYFERYKALEDSMNSNEIVAELNSLKTKYDTEKKQQQIELLTANASKDKIVKIGLLIGAVLLVVVAFLIFNRYRLKSRTFDLLQKQNEIISEKNKDISDSINYAKKIQEAILPSQQELEKVFPNHFVLSLPKDVVSGDFYWFSQHNHLAYFVVADCTGHGVPGAFMSMIGNTLLNNIVNEKKILQPNEILNQLRKEIILSLKQGENSSNKDGMDMSIICLNKNTNEVQIACANNPVWIVKHNLELIEIKPDKQAIGYVSNNVVDFTLKSIQLEKNDTIYQFSDGYADQFGGEKGKKFKYNQFKELLLQINQTELAHQSTLLNESFTNWKGNLAQIDDVLVSGIKI